MGRGRPASTASQPQFRVSWTDAVQIKQDILTGMTEAQAADAAKAARPMMVFIYRDSDKSDQDPRLSIETDRAFQNEKVAIGARFFSPLRMDMDAAKDDAVLGAYAGKAPCLVFVRPNFEVAKVVKARFSTSKVFSAMCVTLRKDYQNCAKRVLKKQKALTKSRNALARDRAKIDQLDARIDDERSSVKRVKLQKTRDALDDKTTAAEQKLDEQEAKLYELQPKTS